MHFFSPFHNLVSRIQSLLCVGLLACSLTTPLAAATLNYDSDSSFTNNITDGAGPGWNTTPANKPWYDSVNGTYLAWPNTNTDIAVFGGGTSGTAGTVTVGTVTANGLIFNTTSAGTYTLNGGTITLDGATPTITTNIAARIESRIVTSSLVKNGTADLILSNSANTLGAVTVNQGRLDIYGGMTMTDATFTGSSTFVTHSGNTWTLSSLTYNTTASTTLYAGNNNSTYTIGTGGLTLSGTGTLTIAADKDVVGAPVANPTAKVVLKGDITVTQNNSINAGGNGLVGAKLLDLDGGVRTVTVDSGKTFNLGVITQNGGFIKQGAGTMVLQAANTYAGNTVINAGTLRLSLLGTLGATTNDVTVATGATLDLGGTSQTQDALDGAGTVTNSVATAATLTLGSNNGTGVFDGTISGTGSAAVAIIKTGSGSQTFTGANTYSGGTTLTSGTLITLDTTTYGTASQIKKALGTGTVTLNGGTLQMRANGLGDTQAETLNIANNMVIGGDSIIDIGRNSGAATSKVIKFGTFSMGAQTLTVRAANSYSLDFTNSTLTGNAIFDVQSGTLNFANTMTGGTNSVTKNGTGRLTIRGGTFGDFIVNSGIGDIYGTVTSQNVIVNGGNLETHSGNNWTMASLTYNSAAGFSFGAFSNNSTYTIGSGGLAISSNTTLAIAAQGAAYTSKLILQGNVTITGNSSLIKNSDVSYLGTMLLDLDGGTRTFDVAATKTFTLGVVTQNGGITKTGTGTMSLTVANTYTGNTTINAGTLKLSSTGSIDSSPRITVANGATFDVSAVTGYSVKNGQRLEGGGSVTGSISIASGALLAPGILGGNEVQKLTISGALTLSSGSQTILDLSNTGTYDQIAVGTAFTQATGAQIAVQPGSFVAGPGQSFNLFDWGSLVSLSTNLGTNLRDGSNDSGTDLDLPDISGSGFGWDIGQFSSSGVVSLVFIAPEPSRMMLFILACMAMMWRRQRSI